MHSRYYQIIIVYILLLASFAYGYAIPENLTLSQCRMDTWSVRDGLPERAIYSMTQTPEGFVWLATDEGLIRFDGSTFKIYNTSNSTGLIDNKFRTLFADRDGQLWYGATWSGFGKFVNGNFKRYGPKAIKWTTTNGFYQDKDGSIWVGESGDVCLYHIVNDVLYPNTAPGMQDGVIGMGQYDNNSIYCVTYSGYITRVIWGNNQPKNLLLNKLDDVYINCCLKMRNGDIFIGTGNHGLIRIHNNIKTIYDIKNGLPSNVITCLCEDKCGRLWIGTNKGVFRWGGTSYDYFCRNEGLIDNEVHSIMEDKEGNLWVAAGSSLSRFSATKLTPYVISRESEKAIFCATNSVSQSKYGGVWCASNIGLYLLKNNKIINFKGPFNRAFVEIAEGPDGLVWLCSRDKATTDIIAVPYKDLMKYATESTITEELLTRPLHLDPALTRYHPVTTNIFNYLIAEFNTLYTIGQSGVTKIIPGKCISNRTLIPTWVFCAAKDKNNDILIGCTDGLLKLHNKQLLYCNQEFPKDTHILNIDVSDPNNLWMSTDKGLIRRSNGKTKIYDMTSGLPSNDLSQMLYDSRGYIWVGCSDGIFSVSIKDLDAYDNHSINTIPINIYISADGVRSYITAFCCAKAIDNTYWFSGAGTLIHVDPSHFYTNTMPPVVKILEAALNNVTINPNRTLRLTADMGSLNVKYAALSYQAPERVRYRYKLDFKPDNSAVTSGYEEAKWEDAGDRRYASFTNLQPGNYKFTVIACNNDGVWNTVGDTLTFTIKPHYYQMKWFYYLKLLCVILLGVLLYRARTRQMVLRNLDLERKVNDRTAELKAEHIALETAHIEIVNRNEDLEAMQQELEAQNQELVAMQESLAVANERLEGLATTDGLTGLKNHRAFQEHLHLEYQRSLRYGDVLSLIMLDVDHFKLLNDNLGHPAGDDVLRRISRLLMDNVRECDFAARYGGEEFIIVAGKTDIEGAMQLAERLREFIETAYWSLQPVTASFGVSTIELKSNTDIDELHIASINEAVEQLIAQADHALYQSKHNGRNRVTHYRNALINA